MSDPSQAPDEYLRELEPAFVRKLSAVVERVRGLSPVDRPDRQTVNDAFVQLSSGLRELCEAFSGCGHPGVAGVVRAGWRLLDSPRLPTTSWGDSATRWHLRSLALETRALLDVATAWEAGR
ncbi:hypothetical protein GA0115251_121963 [Streptomyces sp. TverLS-915]|uniref:hypothetical protein n=1 Tax=Streptomyces sp. TverLS-915 TaxID=1839763 RepID=UPI00081EA06A|nr:hypothetical protein [Streptomyces sp. TverLS-915]SCD75150.1 hypothetical protein GA0115251_121963 [Streptomyces sp. TverLS-915]